MDRAQLIAQIQQELARRKATVPATKPPLQRLGAGTTMTKSIYEDAAKREMAEGAPDYQQKVQMGQRAELGAQEAERQFGGLTPAESGEFRIVPKQIKEGVIERDIETKPEVQLSRDLEKESAKKAFSEKTTSELAMSTLEPKVGYMMRKSGQAYNELKNMATQQFGMDLDFERGGADYWKSRGVKTYFDLMKQTPQMDAISRLRPEIGFEVMRQIGPFRSAEAGMVFTETLPDFSGHIPTDISRAVTTMTKSYVGALGKRELALKYVGRPLSTDEIIKEGNAYEANLIRKLNKVYRGIGVTTKFYGAGESLDDIAKNSVFSDVEQDIIDSHQRKYPDKSRLDIIRALINEGAI